jgi:hypothetical protein
MIDNYKMFVTVGFAVKGSSPVHAALRAETVEPLRTGAVQKSTTNGLLRGKRPMPIEVLANSKIPRHLITV